MYHSTKFGNCTMNLKNKNIIKKHVLNLPIFRLVGLQYQILWQQEKKIYR
jgi:hypothetical protein